jgi:hypothetical protein
MINLTDLRARRHEDDRYAGRLLITPQVREHGRSVHAGHHYVHQDDVGEPLCDEPERLLTRAAGPRLEIRIKTQRNLHDFADIRFIVDVENAKCSHLTSVCYAGKRSMGAGSAVLSSALDRGDASILIRVVNGRRFRLVS